MTSTDHTPQSKPYYTVEMLGSSWKVVANFPYRGGAISNAKELARLGINHHVYLHTRNGQRKHIFVARGGYL